jgi:hypothetical protein
MSETDNRSIPDLISAVAADLGDLVRKESELLRTELSEKFGTLREAAMGLGAGAVLMLGSFLCILAAVVVALSNLMPPAWACVLVGVVTGLVGFTLVRGGAKKAKPSALKPERTAEQIQRDAQFIKEHMQ